MINREQLKGMLDAKEPWSHAASDWRKLANGKVVRFVDWSRAGKGARK